MIALCLNTLESLLKEQGRIVVAYSGGLDSHVLLHVLVNQIPPSYRHRIIAIHVNHGLSPNADAWQTHCQKICDQFGIPLIVKRVYVHQEGSLEEQARLARYDAFLTYLKPEDVLLQAHHANDQAETLLFRLERGVGWAGMQAIPEQRALGEACLWRPFLRFSKADLQQYAEQYQLVWVEDESNQDTYYRRNFLRQHILQPWQQSNPKIAIQMARSASILQSEGRVIKRLIDQQLELYLTLDKGLMLLSLPTSERAFWIGEFIKRHDRSCTQDQLAAIAPMFFSEQDKQPCFEGRDFRLMRFDSALYWLPRDSEPKLGELKSNVWLERPFDRVLSDQPLTLGTRPVGAKIEIKGKNRPIKKWLQDQKIAPWWREHLPYLYCHGELVAIGDLWRKPDWRGQIQWHRNGLLAWPKPCRQK